jgi:hypothetical protein
MKHATNKQLLERDLKGRKNNCCRQEWSKLKKRKRKKSNPQSFLTGYKNFYVGAWRLRNGKNWTTPSEKHFRQNWKKIHRFENNNRTTGHSRNMYFCPEKNPLRPSHASSPCGSKGSRLVPWHHRSNYCVTKNAAAPSTLPCETPFRSESQRPSLSLSLCVHVRW